MTEQRQTSRTEVFTIEKTLPAGRLDTYLRGRFPAISRGAIQRLIQDPLALALLNGEFHDGDTILVGVQGGRIVFEKQVEAHAV